MDFDSDSAVETTSSWPKLGSSWTPTEPPLPLLGADEVATTPGRPANARGAATGASVEITGRWLRPTSTCRSARSAVERTPARPARGSAAPPPVPAARGEQGGLPLPPPSAEGARAVPPRTRAPASHLDDLPLAVFESPGDRWFRAAQTSIDVTTGAAAAALRTPRPRPAPDRHHTSLRAALAVLAGALIGPLVGAAASSGGGAPASLVATPPAAPPATPPRALPPAAATPVITPLDASEPAADAAEPLAEARTDGTDPRAADPKAVAEPAATRRGPSSRRSASRRSASRRAASRRRASPRGLATLRVNAKPPCEIELDGAPTGLTTPALNLQVRPGTHRITLRNRRLGIEETVRVRVRAGEERRVVRDLLDRAD